MLVLGRTPCCLVARPQFFRDVLRSDVSWLKAYTKPFSTTVNAYCKEDNGKGPLKFSGSKADPRYWKVEKSLGSNYLRAWWTVVPISILGLVTFFWCFSREEREVDQKLLTGMQDYWPNSLESVQDGSNGSQESSNSREL
ncbi:protein CCSMST1 [Polypterus senegalus]|nr:protein CCSMST1 [Polypterus senegalus]